MKRFKLTTCVSYPVPFNSKVNCTVCYFLTRNLTITNDNDDPMMLWRRVSSWEVLFNYKQPQFPMKCYLSLSSGTHKKSASFCRPSLLQSSLHLGNATPTCNLLRLFGCTFELSDTAGISKCSKSQWVIMLNPHWNKTVCVGNPWKCLSFNLVFTRFEFLESW